MSHGDKRLKRKRDALNEAHRQDQISDEEHRLIKDFEEHDLANNKTRTVANHLLHLQVTAKRSEDSLAEMDADDLNDLLLSFKAGTHPDVDKDQINQVKNYQSALRKFYRFHGDLAVDDASDIDAEDSDYSGRDLSVDDLLFEEEVDALFTAAQRRDPRDLAALALMLSTGLRIDAARTLRLRHVDQDGPAIDISLNEEEGDLKGARGERPLLWAKHYVRPWLESHPHRDSDDAALFPAREGGANQHDSTFSTEPMADRTFRRMVNHRAEDAEIEKDIYPHLFRHSAMTRMAAQDRLSEQQIKQIAGWHGDSSQFDKYISLAGKLATDNVREAHGVPTSETGPPTVGRPSLDRCPECNDELPEGEEVCMTCNTPLTHGAAERNGPSEEHANPIAAAMLQAVEEHGEDKAGDLLADAVDEVTDALED